MPSPRIATTLLAAALGLTPLLAWGAAPVSKPVAIRCSSILTFPDGSTKQNDPLELIIDEAAGVIRRVDNSLLVSAPDVEISERAIRFSLHNSKVSIDRATGEYRQDMMIAKLNLTVKSVGSCESFALDQRKF